MKKIWLHIVFLGALMSYCSKNIGAQDMPVPVDIQFALFSKVLAFDRNLSARASSEIVIGIVYDDGYPSSLTAKAEIERIVPFFPEIQNRRVRFVYINQSFHDWQERSKEFGINILYFTPTTPLLPERDVRFCREKKIISMSGVVEYVEAGLSIGILVSDGKPLPLINLPAALAEGADFNSRLLQLSRVIE